MTLTIRDLQVAYDDVPAVRGVSLTVPDGQVLAVLGPSGCGKSTLLRGVAGLEQASGEVAWDGEDVSRLPTHRRGFALMFQDGQLFDHLTVARNVGYALRLRRRGGAGRGGRAGERRRVEIARALLHQPRILLLDEASVGLDQASRRALNQHVRTLCDEQQLTVIWTTHLLDEILPSDAVVMLNRGRVVAQGLAHELTNSAEQESLSDAFDRLSRSAEEPTL